MTLVAIFTAAYPHVLLVSASSKCIIQHLLGLGAACKVRLAVFAAQRLQADQLPIPEAVPSKSSIAQATDVVKDGGGVKGGEFSISDSDKVQG